KILEAMSMQVPVVGTRVAFQGIAAEPEDGIRIEDTPEAFAGAVCEFLGDPGLRLDAGRRGRRFVERHHRWQAHGEALESLLTEVVGRRAPCAPTAGGHRCADPVKRSPASTSPIPPCSCRSGGIGTASWTRAG